MAQFLLLLVAVVQAPVAVVWAAWAAVQLPAAHVAQLLVAQLPVAQLPVALVVDPLAAQVALQEVYAASKNHSN